MKRQRIYFAASCGRIKVGTTGGQIERRFAEINSFLVEPLELIGAVDGGVALERLLHARFGQFWLKGEWFKDCDELRQLIRQILLFGPEAVGVKSPPVRSTRKTERQARAEQDVAGLIARAREVWPHKTAEHLSFATGRSIRSSRYWLSGRVVPTGAATFAIAAAIEAAKRRQPLATGGTA